MRHYKAKQVCCWNVAAKFCYLVLPACQLVVRYVDKNGEPNPRMKRPCAMNFRPRSLWMNCRVFKVTKIDGDLCRFFLQNGQEVQ